MSDWSSLIYSFWSQFCVCWQCEEILRRLSMPFKCSANWNMLNTHSMGCDSESEMFAITGTVVTMKVALIYTLSFLWSGLSTERLPTGLRHFQRKTDSLLLPIVTTLQDWTIPLLYITFRYISHFSLCLRKNLDFLFSYHHNQLINCCSNSRLSKRKCVTLCVTLLMGSQSFSSDPYPRFHPLSRQTAHDCPWLLLWCCCLMPQIPPSVTLGWQFSPSCELKAPFANTALTTGASGM